MQFYKTFGYLKDIVKLTEKPHNKRNAFYKGQYTRFLSGTFSTVKIKFTLLKHLLMYFIALCFPNLLQLWILHIYYRGLLHSSDFTILLLNQKGKTLFYWYECISRNEKLINFSKTKRNMFFPRILRKVQQEIAFLTLALKLLRKRMKKKEWKF